jgi:hypothetical protein
VIADNIGIFESPGWNIQNFLEENSDSERVKMINSDEGVLELNESDLLGKKEKP